MSADSPTEKNSDCCLPTRDRWINFKEHFGALGWSGTCPISRFIGHLTFSKHLTSDIHCFPARNHMVEKHPLLDAWKYGGIEFLKRPELNAPFGSYVLSFKPSSELKSGVVFLVVHGAPELEVVVGNAPKCLGENSFSQINAVSSGRRKRRRIWCR